jgi:sec-independent protein translocase protein TatA
MFGGIGFQEILVILIIGLLVFGATRLPKIARSLGLGIKEFKKTLKSVEEDEDEKSQIRYVQNQPPSYQQPPTYPPGSGMQQPGQQDQYYGQNPPSQQNVQGRYGQPGSQPSGQDPNADQQAQQQQPQQQPPSQENPPKPEEGKQS